METEIFDRNQEMFVAWPRGFGGRLAAAFARRSPRMMMGAVVCLALTAGVCDGGRLTPAAYPQAPTEYEVKAAFLLNFAKFVEWPADAFGGDGHFVIGVLGNDPFGHALDQMVKDKSVNGRRVVIRRLQTARDTKGCHILFISSSERGRLSQVLSSLNGSPFLTVADMDRFTQMGGMIGMVMQENKIRFEINVAITELARLKVSSKLLSLATVVRREVSGGS